AYRRTAAGSAVDERRGAPARDQARRRRRRVREGHHGARRPPAHRSHRDRHPDRSDAPAATKVSGPPPRDRRPVGGRCIRSGLGLPRAGEGRTCTFDRMHLGPHVPAWQALRDALDALVKGGAGATLAAVIDETPVLVCWSTPPPPLLD